MKRKFDEIVKKDDQPVQPVKKDDKPVEKRFFKKILFGKCASTGESCIIGLDENNTVHLFDKERKKTIFICDTKNVFEANNYIYGIDLNGKLFSIRKDINKPAVYSEIDLQFEKMFCFPNAFFANTTDKNTYFSLIAKDNIPKPIKIPYYLKKIIKKSYVKDDKTYHIYIGIDHNYQFCIIGKDSTMYGFGRYPKEDMIRLLINKFTEKEIDDMINELLYEKKEERIIDCLEKKMDVKMIYDCLNFSVAADRDGRVYFGGKEKYQFIKTDDKSDGWIETPYFIKVKTKTKKKQKDKLFNILKLKKNCDLLLNFSF
jgi:hypothetical protein